LQEKLKQTMNAVRQFSSFEELPPGAKTSFELAGKQSFFSSLPWFRTFVGHALDEGDHLRIYCAPDSPAETGRDSTLLATVHRAVDSGVLKPRKLSSLSNYYTSLFNLVGNDAGSREGAMELTKAIANDSPAWDEVELKPLDLDSPAFLGLKEGLQSAGFVVQTYFCFGNWYLKVNGRTYAEYLEHLPSVLKNTLRRKKKKLEKTGRARIEIFTGGENLGSAIDAYNKVYSASWKQPEPYPRFVPELISTCARLGALRLGILYFDGEPIAAQFWIVQNGAALIYKLAYDDKFTEWSAGTILTAALMEHAIDVDKVGEIDYLTGDDAYKRDYMSDRRERWGILAMNPRTVRGAAAIARHIGGRAVKRAVQSLAKKFFKEQKTEQAA
jgi:hypothetical protein